MKKLIALVISIALTFMLTSCKMCENKTCDLSVLYLIISIMSLLLFFGYLFFINKKKKWFILLFSSVFVVNAGYFLLSVSTKLEYALWANRISYFGSVFLPFFMYMIIADVCKINISKKVISLLIAVGSVVFSIAASPGYLDIYYKSVKFDVVNGTSVLVKEYGILHSLYLIYLIAYFALMIITILCATYKKKVTSNKHAVTLLCAVFVNICVWFVEQIFNINFEFLSVSYIITELFLLSLYLILEDIDKTTVSEKSYMSKSAKYDSEYVNVLAEISNNLKDNIYLLTPTEKKIFDLYCDGKKTKEVTDILNIKETTLKFHNSNIYGKLGVKSKKQLMECVNFLKKNK